MEWYYLATEDIEAQCIRLHKLKKDEQLPDLLEGFKDVEAVVLINTEDNYELPKDLVSSVNEVPFPILIVKKMDGEKILNCVKRHTESIYARVVAENEVDKVALQPTDVMTTSVEHPSISESSK